MHDFYLIQRLPYIFHNAAFLFHGSKNTKTQKHWYQQIEKKEKRKTEKKTFLRAGPENRLK